MGDELEEILGVAAVQRLRDVVGGRSDAVVAVGTPSGDLLWASGPGSKALFGREPEDFEGSRFEFIHPDDVAAVKQQHERVVGGATVRYAFRGKIVEGGWREASTVAWPVESEAGQLIVSITFGLSD